MRNKIVAFKGGHLLQILSFKRSSYFENGHNLKRITACSSSLLLMYVFFSILATPLFGTLFAAKSVNAIRSFPTTAFFISWADNRKPSF